MAVVVCLSQTVVEGESHVVLYKLPSLPGHPGLPELGSGLRWAAIRVPRATASSAYFFIPYSILMLVGPAIYMLQKSHMTCLTISLVNRFCVHLGTTCHPDRSFATKEKWRNTDTLRRDLRWSIASMSPSLTTSLVFRKLPWHPLPVTGTAQSSASP